jgi:TatD DNase family protein
VGYHPQDSTVVNYESLLWMAKKAMAIGEIGFDLGEHSPPLDLQIKNFHTQMAVAINYNIPALIHCRDQWDIFFEQTQNYKNHKFILHCFTGSKEVAQKLIKEYQCLISISGIVTYKNADHLREAVKFIPMEHLLVETDSPYLTPYEIRKKGAKENCPEFITETIEKIAFLKNITMEKCISQTTKNFIEFFQLPDYVVDYLKN